MIIALHGQVTLYSNILTDIRIAKECGYKGIELHTDKLLRYLNSGMTALHLKESLDRYAIEPVAIDIIGDIEVQDSSHKDALFNLTQRLCEVAEVVGVPTIQVNPFSALEGMPIDKIISLTAENLKIIADIGAERGIRFQIEGAAWTPIHSLEDCLKLIDKTNRTNVGLVIDFWHFWASRGADPEEISRLDPSIIFGVHLCDGLRPAAEAPWPDERDLRGYLPGEGELPVGDWMDAVKSTGYDGFVSGEFLNSKLWESDLLTIAREMREKIEEYL